jgi:lipopolysaccharide biosynthesis protein
MVADRTAAGVVLRFPRPAPRRAIVLAHFDPQGRFDRHVTHAARAYRRLAARLVLVSNGGGRLPRDLAAVVDDYLPRPNVGYDFMAWKQGLATLDRCDYDEIVCANDSVYGPLFDLTAACDDPRTTGADLWGMVLSDQSTARDRPRIPHLQSWFFAMRKPLLESAWFEAFWSGVEPVVAKREIIERFEIGLSRSAAEAGFRIAGLYDATTAPRVALREVLPHVSLAAPRRAWRLIRKSRRTPHNPSELVWWRLLEAGVPFVKVGLFRVNHYGIDVQRVLAELARRTSYDLDLIRGHLARCG